MSLNRYTEQTGLKRATMKFTSLIKKNQYTLSPNSSSVLNFITSFCDITTVIHVSPSKHCKVFSFWGSNTHFWVDVGIARIRSVKDFNPQTTHQAKHHCKSESCYPKWHVVTCVGELHQIIQKKAWIQTKLVHRFFKLGENELGCFNWITVGFLKRFSNVPVWHVSSGNEYYNFGQWLLIRDWSPQ